jgi:ribonuclease G
LEESEIFEDLRFLRGLWKKINDESKAAKSLSVIYRDLDLITRTIRDLMTIDVEQLIIDQRDLTERAKDLINYISPDLVDRVHHYQESEPIFQHYHLENEIDKSLKRKVWLKSGGYIVIDRTEALSVIDVNTGKYTGHHNLEDTVLKINLEAAIEAARQIRLRDLGGIIVIDFIDMMEEKHRSDVLDVLEEEVKKDRTKSHVFGLTRLGLVEMSRKKVRRNLEELLLCPCPACEGSGKVLNLEASRVALERDLNNYKASDAEAIWVSVSPQLINLVIGGRGVRLKEMESKIRKSIYVSIDHTLSMGKYEISFVGNDLEARRRALPVRLGEIYAVKMESGHNMNDKDGIAKIDGYVIDVQEGAPYLGKQVVIKIDEIFSTYARGHIVFVPPYH